MVETFNYALTAFLLPPTGLLLAALLALFGLRRWPRLRVAVVAVAISSLLCLSMPVVAFALMRSIERPAVDENALRNAQAIVILGGGRERSAPEWGGTTVSNFTLQRVRYGARLARETALPVFLAGGAPDGTDAAEATLMAKALQEFSVTARWNDDRSRTTRENARFAAAQLLPATPRIVLVTSSWHSARASAEFRRLGFEVIEAPTGIIGMRPFSLYQLVPNAESLRYAHIALREWFSALWYRLTD